MSTNFLQIAFATTQTFLESTKPQGATCKQPTSDNFWEAMLFWYERFWVLQSEGLQDSDVENQSSSVQVCGGAADGREGTTRELHLRKFQQNKKTKKNSWSSGEFLKEWKTIIFVSAFGHLIFVGRQQNNWKKSGHENSTSWEWIPLGKGRDSC